MSPLAYELERDALRLARAALAPYPLPSRVVREEETATLAETLRRVVVEHLESLGLEVAR
jgi:hypothetical protein